jgi:outer membrane protein assembly factor BamB
MRAEVAMKPFLVILMFLGTTLSAAEARGICVLLGDRDCQQALNLARQSDLTVLVHLADHNDLQAAARAAESAGLYGSRVFVSTGSPSRIPLADNIADSVIAADGAPEAEVLRVLRPGGKATLGQKTFSKPFPPGIDDWTHHYHAPDNNPQSRDQLARAPFLTQFIAEPRYAPAPQACVAAAGRIFMAFGHVAWHEREEPMLNTLIAMNGYNGTLLWKRRLTSGIMVDRSTMIATPTTLYLADEKSCKLLDAATGALTGEIAVPVAPFWKWMALENGMLYALIGEPEPPDPIARWRLTRHGWPWTGISQSYNASQYEWGMSPTLFAIDPNTKKILWQHREETPVDSRAVCLRNGRIYIAAFGKYLACLDAPSGKQLWRRTAENDPELFRNIGPYRPGHGAIGGWKSTVYLKCTDKALYTVGPQVEWLTALDTADGHLLWKHPAKDLHVIIRDDAVYTTAAQNKPGDTRKLDPLTGAILASYDIRRRACTRSTGSADGIFFRAHEGTARLDLATGQTQFVSAVRPSCHVGVIVANGHLYWLPWACDCDLQMFGVFCLGPAGNFNFSQTATDADHLERFAPGCVAVAVSSDDWPTYRANNIRSAKTQVAVPGKGRLLWQTDTKLRNPSAPIAAGGMVFLGDGDGIVRALDAKTGKQRWRGYTGGAIRFPPTLAMGEALVGSDDGYVYAFCARTGQLRWRFRAAPVDRRIPVYGALSSTWPVASGVLATRDALYFAAGINDLDGTHVYALDPFTGTIKWQNNTAGHLDSFSRRGVACQGELLLHDGKLYLAGGNSVSPGIFDAATGECLNTKPGGMGTSAVRGRELRLDSGVIKVSGQPLHSRPDMPVFDKFCEWQDVVVNAPNAKLSFIQRDSTWSLVAGDLWSQPLPSEPVRWGIAVDAQGRIILTLRNGQVLCFAAP